VRARQSHFPLGTEAASSATGVSNRKILILDDDPAVAGLYALALENAGHEVIVCTGFEEARDYVKDELPAGLLTDVRVGEYNGLQLAILFRSLSPSAPLLVVSGHEDSVIRKEVEQIGAAFLLKPVAMSELARFFESEAPGSSGRTQ
jgi:DNA-binding response OmpR family regulator